MVVVKKLSVFVYFVAVIIVLSWYWGAKDDKERCLITLDKYIKISSDLKKDLKEHKEDSQKVLEEKELEISNNKDAIEEKQDKVGVCEEKAAGLKESLNRQEQLAEEKNKLLVERGEEIDKMIEKYKIIKNELVSVQAEEKKWKLERNELKDNEQKLKNEKELLKIDIDTVKSEMELLQTKYNNLAKLTENEANERKAALEAAINEKKQAAEIEMKKVIIDDKDNKKLIEEKKAVVNKSDLKEKIEPDGENVVKNIVIPQKEVKESIEKKEDKVEK